MVRPYLSVCMIHFTPLSLLQECADGRAREGPLTAFSSVLQLILASRLPCISSPPFTFVSIPPSPQGARRVQCDADAGQRRPQNCMSEVPAICDAPQRYTMLADRRALPALLQARKKRRRPSKERRRDTPELGKVRLFLDLSPHFVSPQLCFAGLSHDSFIRRAQLKTAQFIKCTLVTAFV